MIIAVSIPLSILTSIMVLSALGADHQHHDAGRPGAGRRHPGRRRHRRRSKTSIAIWRRARSLREAILDGASQIAVPALVSTLVHLHRVRADVLPAAASRAICSCRWPKPWSSPCSPRICFRGRWFRRWRCTCCGRSRTAKAARAIRWSGSSAASSAASNSSAAPIAALLDRAGALARRLHPGASCCAASSAFAAGSVARPGLLPRHRQRPVHPAPARQDRHAHRRDRAALRPGGERASASVIPAARWTRSSTTSACRTAASI